MAGERGRGAGLWIAAAVLAGVIAGVATGRWRSEARPSPEDAPAARRSGTVVEDAVVRPEYVGWRQASEFDPGSITMLLHNGTDREQRIKRITLDGMPVVAWGVDQSREPEVPPARMFARAAGVSNNPDADESAILEEAALERRVEAAAAAGFSPTYWARVWPESLLPDSRAEVTLKLVMPLKRVARIDVEPSDAPAFTVLAHPAPTPFTISLAVLPYARDGLYLYVKNDGEQSLTPGELTINGKPAQAWRSTGVIAPGGEALLIHRPARPFPPGEVLLIHLKAVEGPTAFARTRALGGFALGMQFGTSPEGFGLDPGTYTLAVPRQVAAWGVDDPSRPAPPAYSLHNVLPMDCPLCPFGYVDRDRFKTARELLRRHAMCLDRFPFHPALIHVCRINAEEGYAIFAEAADWLSFNPSTNWTATTKDKRETPQATVAKLCRYGAAAAAPRPFVCMADAARLGTRSGENRAFATPYEFRTRIFTMLGLGAKGMLYRHNDTRAESSGAAMLAPEIPRVNAEVRAMRDLLAIAHPYGDVSVEGWPALAAHGLLAGDRALVVFVVRGEGIARPGEAMVRVAAALPAWAKATAVARVTPGGLEPMPDAELGGEAIRFSLPLPKDAEAFVITLAVNE